MKVKKLLVYGYGKWVDTTFDFSDDFHVIYGENEAGKSTLLSFIHSILFGFPSKISSELRYEPKKGTRYGGKIIIEDQRYGLVEIERIRGKGAGEVTVLLPDGSVGTDDILNEILYGMNKDWYNSIFSIDLDGLRNVHKFNRTKLQRFFLSAGTLGTEKYLEEADKLNKEATKLFKPTGRVPEINKKLATLKKKQKKVNEAKESYIKYNTLKEDLKTNKEKLASFEKQLNDLKNEIEQRSEMKKFWNQLKELEQLNFEVEKSVVTFLPKDGLYQLQHYNKELSTIQKTLSDLQTRFDEYQQTFMISKELKIFQENNEDIKNILQNTEDIRETMNHYYYLKKEKEKIKNILYQEKSRLGLSLSVVSPVIFSEEENSLIKRQERKRLSLSNLKENLLKELNHNEYKKDQLLKEIDELEFKMRSPEELKKAEMYFESNPNKRVDRSVKNHVSLTIWNVIIGLSFIVAILFLSPNNMVRIPTVLLTIIGLVYFNEKKRNSDTVKELDWTYEEFIHQKEWRNNWQKKLAEIDNVEREILVLKDKLKENGMKRAALMDEWNKFLERKNISNSLIPNQLLEKHLFQQLNHSFEELEKVTTEIKIEEKNLKQWVDDLSLFESLVDFSAEYHSIFKSIQQIIQKVTEEKNQKKENITKIDYIKKDIQQLIQHQRNLFNDKMSFLKEYDVNTEEELKLKYKTMEEYNRKKDRIKLIQEQINQFDESENLATQFKEYQSIEQVQENLVLLNEKKSTYTEKMTELRNRNAKIEVELEHLEKDGTLNRLLQDLASEQAEIQDLVDTWIKRKLAAVLIEKTLKFAKKDRLPQTINDSSIYFAYLTEDRYKNVLINDNEVKVLNREGQYFEAAELSRGTAEQLYISLRLAFIKNIEDKMKLPILIDEGFVNFDETRNKRMFALLHEFSLNHQILFFTFNLPQGEELSSAQITVL